LRPTAVCNLLIILLVDRKDAAKKGKKRETLFHSLGRLREQQV
jgi:hypothetical protein